MENNQSNWTRIQKGRNGWNAKTQRAIGEHATRGVMLLTIHTFGGNGNLVTCASVGFAEGNMVRHILHKDFNRKIESEACGRITEKSVTLQHEKILKDIDAITQRALCHYTPIKFETLA